jgi:hypothetical protein
VFVLPVAPPRASQVPPVLFDNPYDLSNFHPFSCKTAFCARLDFIMFHFCSCPADQAPLIRSRSHRLALEKFLHARDRVYPEGFPAIRFGGIGDFKLIEYNL